MMSLSGALVLTALIVVMVYAFDTRQERKAIAQTELDSYDNMLIEVADWQGVEVSEVTLPMIDERRLYWTDVIQGQDTVWVRCSGTTLKKEQCKRKVRLPNKYCWQHVTQDTLTKKAP